VSVAHLTINVPPWLSALQVPVQSTVHVAPEAQVTVDPGPTVSVQSLPASHATLADAPAVSRQVAWLWHSRFALSAAPMVQSVPAAHCVLQLEPQVPVHVAEPPQAKEQPPVCEVQAPVPLRLQAPLVHEQDVPAQLAGTLGDVLEPDEPHAIEKQRSKLAKKVLRFVMKAISRYQELSKEVFLYF
jgi:hypothetical protein